MRTSIILLALVSAIAPAVAQTPEPSPEVATLGQMLEQAQRRETQATYRAIVAERRAAAAEAALASAKAPAPKGTP